MSADATVEAAFISHAPEQTRRAAARMARRLRAGDVLALCGPLGAGKTEFVRGLAEGLGVPGDAGVASPTFVLAREYAGRLRVYHLDAYRLGGADELLALGFDEMCAAADAVVAVEWADRVRAAMPVRTIWIELDHAGTDRRTLRLAGPVRRAAGLAAALGAVLRAVWSSPRSVDTQKRVDNPP